MEGRNDLRILVRCTVIVCLAAKSVLLKYELVLLRRVVRGERWAILRVQHTATGRTEHKTAA